MRAVAYKILCFTLAAGFAPASQLANKPVYENLSAAADSARAGEHAKLKPGSLNPMTEEKAFYYNVAISGHPDTFVDSYARSFDEGYSALSMNDEFERERYRAVVRTKLLSEVAKIDFTEQFTFVCPVRLGEYSFSEHAFPLDLDRNDAGFLYFTRYTNNDVFGVNPFVAGRPVNVTDIRWSVPMSEDEGSAFVSSHPDRGVMMKVTYSVTRKKAQLGDRTYLVPVIAAVEIFRDDNLTERLGELSVSNRAAAREGL